MRARRSGFTLVEVLIAVAVVAILAAVGVASLRGSERANRLSTATRTVLGDIREVRSLVATGALVNPGVPGSRGASFGGLQITGPGRYDMYLGNSAELAVVHSVDLRVAPDSLIRVDFSGGPDLRFKKDGSIAGNTITIDAPDLPGDPLCVPGVCSVDQMRRIIVTGVGLARLEQ